MTDALCHTDLIHLNLQLQPQICGDLLHVVHAVCREAAVGQECAANTRRRSTRCGHIS